jgi:N-acetylmuramate 1-kinase
LSENKSSSPGSIKAPTISADARNGETELLNLVAAVLRKERVTPAIVKLEGDASTRSYFRLLLKSGETAILVRYPDASANDMASFLDVQEFLEERGLPVPKIHGLSPGQGLVVLEDLGDDLLETEVEREGPDRTSHLYTEAVDLLLRLRHATLGMHSGCVAFHLAFDLEKLMQEMQFFLVHFVQGLCKIQPSPSALRTIQEFFTRICELLASEPRIFAHRDYHSRNLMVSQGRLVMIDFQDARMGPAQYDLASLLRDSYVTLPEGMVRALVDRYHAGMENSGDTSADRFRYVFDVMSLQRNIKALGTFGYQVAVRGSRRYIPSIPRTGGYVAANIARHGEFSSFRAVVEELVCAPSADISTYLNR